MAKIQKIECANPNCKNKFVPKTKRAVFCQDYCRVAASRIRKKAEAEQAKKGKKRSEGESSRLIKEVKAKAVKSAKKQQKPATKKAAAKKQSRKVDLVLDGSKVKAAPKKNGKFKVKSYPADTEKQGVDTWKEGVETEKPFPDSLEDVKPVAVMDINLNVANISYSEMLRMAKEGGLTPEMVNSANHLNANQKSMLYSKLNVR